MQADAEYERLLADKAARLEELKGRKPGQKGYKRRLKAFLEADAVAQKALLGRVDELLEAPKFAPDANAPGAASQD